METLWQDLRYAFRMLRKNPGFTAVPVLTLALGIGANTAIFCLVDTLLMQPPAVRTPEQLVGVYQDRGSDGHFALSSYPDYLYFRDHNTVLSVLALHYSSSPLSLVARGRSREINGAVVSGNYFSVLGLSPLLGRFFLPEEDAVPNQLPVAVLGYDLWQRWFESDPHVLGATVKLNSTVFTVVGVARKGFRALNAGEYPIDIWIPSMMSSVGYRYCDFLQRDCTFIAMIGRLKSGRTVNDAQAEMTVLARQLEEAYPATNKGLGASVTRLFGVRPDERPETARFTAMLMAAVTLAVLIACANLAGLLLARSTARRKEIALRLAIGAGPARLVRQLLTESVLLSLLGGAAGLLVAVWGKGLLASFYAVDAEGRQLFFDPRITPSVLAYMAGLSVLAGLVFGLVPALQSSRLDLVIGLKDDGSLGGYRPSRLRSALIIAQVAISVILVAGAGLVIGSVRNIRLGPGLDPTHIALVRLEPGLLHYSKEKSEAFHRELLRRFEAMPGVEAVSFGRGFPLGLQGGAVSVYLPGHKPDRPEDDLHVPNNQVSSSFFETLQIPITEGRAFDERDRKGVPRVVIVNQTLAHRLWGTRQALGMAVVIDGKEFQVVGIAKDVQYHTSLESPVPFLYLPFWQSNLSDSGPVDSRMCVRVVGDPRMMLPQIRRAIGAVDPDVPISEDRPMTEALEEYYTPVRLASAVLGYSGLLALILSGIGVYGMLAFAVNQRTREIGIRIALGARRGHIFKLAMGQGVVLTLIGVAVGLAGSFGLTRFLSSLLYGVYPNDFVTLIVASLSLVFVALLASYIPARRATKVDPMVALRYE